MSLRPYQQDAYAAAVSWMTRCCDPALLELATGAGKAHIVAALADWAQQKSGKKVLCLAPSRELTEQNHEKYELTGNPASYYSASLGRSMVHPVVYGTPQTVANDLRYFKDQFGVVIVDECHETTPTIRKIIQHMRDHNRYVRVIGLTATPYTMQTGYIYSHESDGTPVEEASEGSYYKRRLYSVRAPFLIEHGYLTRPNVDPEHAPSYDTSGLELAKTGKFTESSVEQAFVGKGRLTADIVADVVAHSQGRRGVMFFASTVQHAKEIMLSLPADNAEMIGGDLNMGKERPELIKRFKAQRFKYLVSVGTLTRGFDATHVDVIAILRATESPVLLQQIIGRGLRLHEGKSDCLVLDYAGNIERHGLQDDLFAPDVKAPRKGEKGEPMQVACPSCSALNTFSGRPNPDNLGVNDNGYFVDGSGLEIATDYGPMPTHYGRRCRGQVISAGMVEQCSYRWTFRKCPECDHENDIAARYCERCRAEIIDPNQKLQLEFQRIKNDPSALSTDKVLACKVQPWTSNAGRYTLRVDYTTEYATFPLWYSPEINRSIWLDLCKAVFGKECPSIDLFVEYYKRGNMPTTITASKPKGSTYYRVYAHNRPEDKAP